MGVDKATNYLEEYWSKVQQGAFEIMPMKMPPRVKSARDDLQALIGEISKTEDPGKKTEEAADQEDGYCYDWSLLEDRLRENFEAEFLEEPYEALEEQLKEPDEDMQFLKGLAEQQWQD